MAEFVQDKVALIYDFDGTLCPEPMQHYTIFPLLEIDAEEFWGSVKEETQRVQGDEILTYMRMLVDRIEAKKEHLTREDLSRLADGIDYFPGVEGWFERINTYVAEHGRGDVEVRHYIISSGLAEIIDGTSIRGHFHRVYGSEYFYDHHGAARQANLAINDTYKTQFLFRINKGRERLEESINDHMPKEERPIPFSNMVYVGDGMTDVPCMNVVRKYGGYSLAVHPVEDRGKEEQCRKLFQADRVDFFTPADYSQGSELEQRVMTMLDVIIARIRQRKEAFRFQSTVQ